MRLAAGVLFLAIVARAPAAAPRIADAESYSRKCGGQALIVLQRGRTLYESYAAGGAAHRPHLALSITKNLAALAFLAASASGLLSLDEPVAQTIAEWRRDPAKSRITIRELLHQTAGLADGYNALYSRKVRDKSKAVLSLPLVAPPGELFDYAPSNYELLEEILRRKLAPRRTNPLAWLSAKILSPLGIPLSSEWRRDRGGNPFLSTGATLTARQLAKIGEFVRTRGRVWLLPVLPSSAFDGAFAGSTANPMYGLSFWLNANAAREDAVPVSIEGTLGEERPPGAWRRSCISLDAPPDLIAMVGSGGQRCYIVPSQNLVIVRFGNFSTFSDAEFLGRLFGHR